MQLFELIFVQVDGGTDVNVAETEDVAPIDQTDGVIVVDDGKI